MSQYIKIGGQCIKISNVVRWEARVLPELGKMIRQGAKQMYKDRVHFRQAETFREKIDFFPEPRGYIL